MWYISLVSFLFYFDWPERRFVDCYMEVGNLDATLRHGIMEAAMEGSVEFGYLYVVLLLSNHEDEVDRRRGVEFFEAIRISGEVNRCRELFTEIFEERWVDERPSDPG
ncbi:hypothetical protein AHAS_Ahas11G0195700 [Arachis hypogaea]